MSKRLRFFVVAMALCICSIACLCSFAPPQVGWTTYKMGTPTETDVENLIAVTEFQYLYGSFNNFIPIACHYYGNGFRLYLSPTNSNWEVTIDGTDFNVTTATQTILRCQFTAEGFGLTYTIAPYSGTNLVFYRNTNGELVKNANFTYSTGTDDDTIADCAAAWYETFKVVNEYESAIEEAESEGYNNGYGEGESIGYTNGYGAGYNQGQFDGLGQGFDLGYADGITDGYESGYDRGYAEGFIDGYDTGKAGGGGGSDQPIIEPSFELDIPEIFDGMADGVTSILSAFDIEIFGINIVGLLIAILVIAIVAFIIRKLVK